jgi:hypothetical protein
MSTGSRGLLTTTVAAKGTLLRRTFIREIDEFITPQSPWSYPKQFCEEGTGIVNRVPAQDHLDA